jgi:hypothetical protein
MTPAEKPAQCHRHKYARNIIASAASAKPHISHTHAIPEPDRYEIYVRLAKRRKKDKGSRPGSPNVFAKDAGPPHIITAAHNTRDGVMYIPCHPSNIYLQHSHWVILEMAGKGNHLFLCLSPSRFLAVLPS